MILYSAKFSQSTIFKKGQKTKLHLKNWCEMPCYCVGCLDNAKFQEKNLQMLSNFALQNFMLYGMCTKSRLIPGKLFYQNMCILFQTAYNKK